MGHPVVEHNNLAMNGLYISSNYCISRTLPTYLSFYLSLSIYLSIYQRLHPPAGAAGPSSLHRQQDQALLPLQQPVLSGKALRRQLNKGRGT